MQRFTYRFVAAFCIICRDLMMTLLFVDDRMMRVLKKFRIKFKCRKIVRSFVNVCQVLKIENSKEKTRIWNSNIFQGCFEVSYDAEVSMAPLLQDAPILQQSNRSFSGPNVSVVHIFYKNNYFRSQKKNEIIGFTEFLCELSLIISFLKKSECFDVNNRLILKFLFNIDC